MKLQAKSLFFAAELERRISEFKGKKVKATLVVGDDAKFWKYMEFGTALHRGEAVFGAPPASEFGVTGPGDAYEILPHGDYKLRFPDPSGKYNLEHDEEGFAYAERIPASDEREGVSHPGVTPTAFIRKVLPAIQQRIGELLRESLSNAGLVFSAVRDVVHGPAMQATKELIVESLAKEVTGTRPDGRLGGRTAADVFADSASIRIDE